jgi:hypothetical protein
MIAKFVLNQNSFFLMITSVDTEMSCPKGKNISGFVNEIYFKWKI